MLLDRVYIPSATSNKLFESEFSDSLHVNCQALFNIGDLGKSISSHSSIKYDGIAVINIHMSKKQVKGYLPDKMMCNLP